MRKTVQRNTPTRRTRTEIRRIRSERETASPIYGKTTIRAIETLNNTTKRDALNYRHLFENSK